MKTEGFKQDVVVGAINNYITGTTRKPKDKANVDADGTEMLYGYDDLGTAILAGDGGFQARLFGELLCRDMEGMKAVRQALAQIGYVEYEKTALRDWVRTDLRGRLYKAVEAGNLAAAREYSKGLQAGGVTVKSLLNSLETKFKPVLAGYARAGDTARMEALGEMLVGLGLTEYRVRGWAKK